MNRRIRTRSPAADAYLLYLKPGALAQLRDRKINARTNHRSSNPQIYLSRSTPSPSPAFSPSRSSTANGSGQQEQQEASGTITSISDAAPPNFSVRFYGPRCPQRKKLMAARYMFILNPNPSSPTPDVPGPGIDDFTNDFLVAH